MKLPGPLSPSFSPLPSQNYPPKQNMVTHVCMPTFFSLPVLEVVEAYDVPVFAPSACELECKPSSLCLYRCSLTSSELCLASIAIR